jgi:hypothetical protein
MVTNLKVLAAAEAKLAELKAAADKAAADAATAKIDAIGTVSLQSEAAVKAARAAYDALTDEQKALLTKLDVLTAAEAKLAELKSAAGNAAADQAAADTATAKIDAIGEVTLESEEAIKAARAAYTALTEEQKVLVSNVDALLAAESKLDALKDAAEKAEKLNDAKTVAGNALEAMTVTNDTTKDEVQKAVSDALAKAQISDVNGVVSAFEITAATTENAGEAKITVKFTVGDASDEAVYTKTIEKLEPVAAPGDDPNLVLPIILGAVCLASVAFVSVIIFKRKGKFKN